MLLLVIVVEERSLRRGRNRLEQVVIAVSASFTLASLPATHTFPLHSLSLSLHSLLSHFTLAMGKTYISLIDSRPANQSQKDMIAAIVAGTTPAHSYGAYWHQVKLPYRPTTNAGCVFFR
jgi:hypothetical protein